MSAAAPERPNQPATPRPFTTSPYCDRCGNTRLLTRYCLGTALAFKRGAKLDDPDCEWVYPEHLHRKCKCGNRWLEMCAGADPERNGSGYRRVVRIKQGPPWSIGYTALLNDRLGMLEFANPYTGKRYYYPARQFRFEREDIGSLDSCL